MPTVCFVSYEIFPTTPGGCGVLLHHAAELLLSRGFDVVFLLDVPRADFDRFDRHDRLAFTNHARCRAYDVHSLSTDMAHSETSVGSIHLFRSLRFAHALRKVLERERVDYVEFFDYCGVGYHALVEPLFEDAPQRPVTGVRLHGAIELIDAVGPTRCAGLERHRLYALERAAIRMADVVLTPTRAYYEAYHRDGYGLAPERVVVSQPPKVAFPRVTRRPVADGPCRILFVGRMFHLKGVDRFVHAACMLLRRRPDLPCTFELIGADTGETPFGTSCVAYLRETIPPDLHPRFTFSGHLTHAQIAARLDETLFAVFPNRFESFCYALHEVYDAGVPVIVNGLPSFRTYFEHERNALVYDGTTEGLLGAMERLLDDAPLRERLCRPYAVAEDPLGGLYDQPRKHAPAGIPRDNGPLAVLAIVLCPEGLEQAEVTLHSLERQAARVDNTICLVPAADRPEAILHWLGRAWHVRDAAGHPVEVTQVLTRDAMVVLNSGDMLHPEWLKRTCRALRRRTDAGFAGTWLSRGGNAEPGFIDLMPEWQPLHHGTELSRVLLRTEPGRLVADLFDANLGRLGELGYLWDAVARWGPGVLYPYAMIEVGPRTESLLDLHLAQYLLMSRGGAFSARWGPLAGIAMAQAQELRRAVEAQTAMIDDRDAAIAAQTRMIDDRDAAIAAQTRLIDERDAILRYAQGEACPREACPAPRARRMSFEERLREWLRRLRGQHRR